ncbi:hypothetical protein QQF64_012933 [Cirrhinus molitorella]|uniref:Uncharacterized protein n=1 Tax=Cirrhinus molitorella TaxID=172907 RepID=A0ABR3LPR9_9TELE
MEYSNEELDFLYSYLFSGFAEKNTRNLMDAFYHYNFTEDFLKDKDLNIPLFPTTIQQAPSAVNLNYDLDGIVMQINDLAGLKQRLHYLFVGKVCGASLQQHWPILKKHLQLNKYNTAAMSNLFTTAFIDGGLFHNLSIMTRLCFSFRIRKCSKSKCSNHH